MFKYSTLSKILNFSVGVLGILVINTSIVSKVNAQNTRTIDVREIQKIQQSLLTIQQNLHPNSREGIIVGNLYQEWEKVRLMIVSGNVDPQKMAESQGRINMYRCQLDPSVCR